MQLTACCNHRMRTPLVVALVAVTALLASAATVGADRLITGADIKDGSITGAEIKNGSITGRDIKRGSIDVSRLEAAGRNRVFVSKPRGTARTSVGLGRGQTSNVASISVPAGQYAIQATASVWWTSPTNVVCGITDSAGILKDTLHQQVFVTWYDEGIIPVTALATAKYTSTTTVYFTCQTLSGYPTIYYPTIIAEQVTLAVG